MKTARAHDVLSRPSAPGAPPLVGEHGAHAGRLRRRASVAAAGVLAASCVGVALVSATGTDRLEPLAATPASTDTTTDAGTGGLVDDGRDRGFLRAVDDGPDGPTLVLDRAVLLSGDAADAEAAARGEESPVPNDVMVVNDDPRLLEYRTSDDATVGLTVGLAPVETADVPVESSLAELSRLLPPPSGEPVSGYLFDVVVEDGVVVALDHVYVP